MRNTSSLDALLPKTRQGILAATLVQPDKAWYVSEPARRMEVPPSSLQRELPDTVRSPAARNEATATSIFWSSVLQRPRPLPCLCDVTAKGLSADARFIMAYDAARTLSVMIVRAAGYREIGRWSLQHLPRSRSSRPASIRRVVSVLRWLPQQTQYLRIRRRRRRYRH
jgi:hypothetical protein